MIKQFFRLNTWVELLGGLVIILFPRIITFNVKMTTEALGLAYLVGVQACFIGLLMYLISKMEVTNIFYHRFSIGLCFYNIVTGCLTYFMFYNRISLTPMPALVHFIIAIIWVVLIFIENNKSKFL
jgi:hypothetical protein